MKYSKYGVTKLNAKIDNLYSKLENNMKILWITNSPFPEVFEKLNVKAPVTVGWVYSAAQALINLENTKIELAIASFYKGDVLKRYDINDFIHFVIPDKVRKHADNNRNDHFWYQIIEQYEPDVIHIHGTEYAHTYSFLRAYGSKNVVVSIQGLVSVYERYYYGNIEKAELRRAITIRDIIKLDTIFTQHKYMRKRGEYEKQVINRVNHIIGRTSWDREHTWAVNPDATYHFCNETLRPSFYKNKWSIDQCEKHSIFISQAQYPIKGFHQVVKAFPLILRHFPDAKIYVAGHDFFSNRGIRLHGFGNYINSLIHKLNLSDKIIFTGLLTEGEMCQRFINSHVFVCPSAIENSPNSVGEAQLLGVPCVSSYVGGTADMIAHGESGLLYRFEEVEMLASSICQVFSSNELALHISEGGRIVATKRHNKCSNAKRLYDIYMKIRDEK